MDVLLQSNVRRRLWNWAWSFFHRKKTREDFLFPSSLSPRPFPLVQHFLFGSNLLPLWCLKNFDSSFLSWTQEKNAKFKLIRSTIRKSVLAQTRDKFWHILWTLSLRLIVWLTRLKCISTLIHWHVLPPWPFPSRIWTNLTFLKKNFFPQRFSRFLSSFSLKRTLAHDKKRSFQNESFSQSINQGPASVVCAVCTCWLTGTFYLHGHFHHGFGPIWLFWRKISSHNVFLVSWAVLVSKELLSMI